LEIGICDVGLLWAEGYAKMVNMAKRWLLKEKYEDNFRSDFPEINGVILQLLYNRGLKNPGGDGCFLGPDYCRDQNDPFLFKEMEAAVKRIFKAVEKREKIVIYGDYDADGVTATAVLFRVLKRIGAENLSIRIPNRLTEGYGMNNEAVEELAREGAKLIITVDCGISNKEEIKLAREKGIDVIITDHHAEPDDLPAGAVMICPTLKKKNIPLKIWPVSGGF